MKKFLLFMVMMLISLPFFAQTGGELVGGETAGTVIDFTTFTGIAAAVSMLVTQLCKVVPKIADVKWLKIIVALASGIVVCLLAKVLNIGAPLVDLNYGQVALYGIFAGSTSCGLYDILKGIFGFIGLLKKNE